MVTIDYSIFEISGKWFVQNNSNLDWFEKSFDSRVEAMKFLFELLLTAEKDWVD